jgi:hypothetical protein
MSPPGFRIAAARHKAQRESGAFAIHLITPEGHAALVRDTIRRLEWLERYRKSFTRSAVSTIPVSVVS